ncbi:CoA transferase, partial [Azospirillum brasilense]|nr:CoA transferase [Azospirillum brasilense]
MPLPFLSGLRVIDLGQYLPGPYAAQMLADLGAEVVKVEAPSGDPLRQMGPTDADGTTAAYKLLNAGQPATRLNLRDTGPLRAFETLIPGAEALGESVGP